MQLLDELRKRRDKIRQQRELHDDLTAIFSGSQGERALAALAEEYHVFSAVHTPGDSEHTAFNDGQRDVVLRLIHAANLSNPFTLIERQIEDQLNDARRTDDPHSRDASPRTRSDRLPAVPAL